MPGLYADYTQALSIPVQLAVRVYVAACDEPGVLDVLDFDDADRTGRSVRPSCMGVSGEGVGQDW
jgi:hypothetical protein